VAKKGHLEEAMDLS